MMNDISKEIEEALARARVRRGDMRTSEQVQADVEKRYYYTPEEADELIKGIENSPFHFFKWENSAGFPVSYTKEEEIARIRKLVRLQDE